MKTILVTGAAKRIGKAILTHFAQHGWNTILHYRHSKQEAFDLCKQLVEIGSPRAIAVQADLANRADVKALFTQIAQKLDTPVTALVNNASLFEDDRIDTLSEQSWDQHMDVNLLAPVLLSQQFIKQLPASHLGNIINIIDQRVWKLNPQFFSYTTSKAALWTITQTMAQALAPTVRVNAIGPGPVLASIHQTNEIFASEAKNVPLQQGPTPQEIAKTIDTIIQTPSMTGQMIALDGGQHLAWQTPDIPV